MAELDVEADKPAATTAAPPTKTSRRDVVATL